MRNGFADNVTVVVNSPVFILVRGMVVAARSVIHITPTFLVVYHNELSVNEKPQKHKLGFSTGLASFTFTFSFFCFSHKI